MIHSSDEAGGVRVLTLDHPPANALDYELLVDLDRAVGAAEDDDAVRAVVLTAEGRFFCAGFDLRSPPRAGDEVEAMVGAYRAAHRHLLALPKPTLALVNGHAIAGGLVLALACDHRFSVEGDHLVGVNEVAIGAAYPSAAIEIVRLRLRHEHANHLVLGADLHPAGVAVDMGIVEAIVSGDRARSVVLERASRLGSYPRDVYAHAKRALIGDALERIDATSTEEELATAALWTTDESRAARSAQRRSLS